MKKILSVILSGALALSLAACGEKEPAAFDPAADAKTLLDSGAFVDTLEEIDQATACALYGIDESIVTGCAVYMANATSAEELAIFTFSGAEEAQAAATLLGYRVEDQKDALSDYLPGELPKLDKAVVETRSNSVLLAVAADAAPVNDFLEG